MKVQKITSRSNERLVRIRKVRDGKESDKIFIEGLRLAEETLRSNIELIEAVFSSTVADTKRRRKLLDELEGLDINLIEISDELFNTLADTTHSQGVALIAQRPETGSFERVAKSKGDLFLYLHEINDPSNVGAVFRTAEAAGVQAVILSKGSADAFSPKALRAGMAANLRLKLWDKADTGECILWAREQGIRVVAADIKGKRSYVEMDWKSPSLLMFGSEAHGLDDSVLELADEVFNIPMKNGVESLNLAVSAGIIMFEAVRQNS
jgi:RNA methyltransferase, TrmH family